MNIPTPPPLPAAIDLQQQVATRKANRDTVSRYARDFLESAVITLGELTSNPKASTAQVRACELIIQWAAGAPERFVHIAPNLEGQTVFEAMDTVIASTMRGECSVEAGEALLEMIKKRASTDSELDRLQRQLREFQDAFREGRAPRQIT